MLAFIIKHLINKINYNYDKGEILKLLLKKNLCCFIIIIDNYQ